MSLIRVVCTIIIVGLPSGEFMTMKPKLRQSLQTI